MHVPRFARVFVLALTLVTVPSLYFFYPGPANPDHIQSSLDKGGIDSDHIREPVVPHLAYPDHNNQNAQDGHDHQQNHQQVQQGNGRPVFEDEAARDDEEIESGANDDHVDVDDAEDDDYADVAGPAAVTETLADNAIGKVIMPKLGNATAKAELGRATWRFLHTMTLRFPDKPTPDERETLRSFFYLFSQLYPCGECAAHFQKMLEKYPPQTSSRKTASLWLCSLHNIVNARLEKPEFDCLTLDSTYDCGCGNETSSALPEATGSP